MELVGVILAGGTGSRLMPLTKVTNKHLLPVGRYPMIFHPIHKLVSAGVTQIMVVTGTEHMGAVVGLLGSGNDFGAEFSYRVQDEPGGIAQALGLVRHFAAGHRMVVILGDNVFQDDLTPFVEHYKDQPEGAHVLLKEVPDAHRFGVADVQGDRIVGIEEKPKSPKSPYAVTGIYMYDSNVFDVISTLKPSHRKELEITDVNNWYIQKSQLTFDVFRGWWSDAGTFPSLTKASQLLAETQLDFQDAR